MTRILGEAGELVQQVAHFESRGIKREKHGKGDHGRDSSLVGGALYYGVDREVEAILKSVMGRLAQSMNRHHSKQEIAHKNTASSGVYYTATPVSHNV